MHLPSGSFTGNARDINGWWELKKTGVFPGGEWGIQYSTVPTMVEWYVSETLDSQKAPQISPSRASYGVSFVEILEKIESVITALHWILKDVLLTPGLGTIRNIGHKPDGKHWDYSTHILPVSLNSLAHVGLN